MGEFTYLDTIAACLKISSDIQTPESSPTGSAVAGSSMPVVMARNWLNN